MKYYTSFLNFGFLTILVLFQFSCSKTEKRTYSGLDSLLNARRLLLPNGWSLSVPGESIPVGDLPLNLVQSNDGNMLAVTNNGQSKQSIMLVDSKSFIKTSEIEIPKSWYGLTFNNDDSKLFASGGNDNMIRVYDTSGKSLVEVDTIVLGEPWPVRISPTGLTLDKKNETLYVTTKEDSALYRINLQSRETKRLFLDHEAYASKFSNDESELFVSLWGGEAIAVVDPVNLLVLAEIQVGSNPNDLVLTSDGKYLFTSCANDNTVHVIDLESRKVIEKLQTACFPDAPAGSTPNALAISKKEKRLYVANADNNSLAVFDISEIGESRSLGFIPTGWYPTSVKVFDDKVWVTNGKGSSSFSNPKGPNPYKRRTADTQYIGGLLKGSLTMIDEPDESELKVYTEAVYKNTPYSKALELQYSGEEGNPIPQRVGDPSPIKYVFYIIKENRTYDQVLGDMPEGNGDPEICLFPEIVTPNQHKLARGFVLLDNFYVNAEVSADGHNWSMAAYATDFLEKTWPTRYSGRGGVKDGRGTKSIAMPSDGYLWSYCQRAGVSYRSYGQFAVDGKPNLESLIGHVDSDYPGYNLAVTDLDRFEKWKEDFDSLLAINAVPQFSSMRVPNDHTSGTRVGAHTPRAMVAENDLAVGKLVEYISNSSIWAESAIFILEDDAQNGPDHVDAHRTTAYVASPYAKRNTKVSTMYSTTSMLRTMELILGLPPMSQYDAASTPMWECFTATPDFSPFVHLDATYDINEKNVEKNVLSELSDSFNLEEIDAAPDHLFSQVIWKSIKGLNSEMPAPVRAAFVLQKEEDY
ncbi:MAG: DNA-binding beta-propeller fold protein YncE [Cyclobacteriaceae bacterium]|jgi:DNA-binding beta-propeller fold protein YncE